MTDPLAGLQGDAASAEAPGLPGGDIESSMKAFEAKFEERIKGFQRIIASKDERLNALDKELKSLKTASLSPEELEELELQEKDRRIAELESKLELQALAGQFPDEMPYFTRLLDAESAEDQLKALREMREALLRSYQPAPAQQGGPEEDFVPGDVDPNHSRRTDSGSFLGGQMNEELADRILKSFSGTLAGSRRR